MADAPPTLAPAVAQQSVDNFQLAMNGKPIPAPAPLGARTLVASNAGDAPASVDTGVATPVVTMQNVPDNSGGGTGISAEVVSAPNTAPAPGPSDAAPTSTDNPPTTTNAAPGASGTPESSNNIISTPTGSGPTAVGPNVAGSANSSANPAPAAGNPERVYGLAQPVGPNTPAPLPPIDKPAAAPDQINDVKSNGQPQVSTGTTSGKPGKKKPKPAYSGGDESSSKHHPKKGVDKLNPL